MSYAIEFQKEFNFSITCIHAFKTNKPRRRVEKFKTHFPSEFKFKLIKGDLFSCFKYYENTHKIDFVIMGTKGAQGIKKLFKCSNTKKIMLQTITPILIIPEESRYESLNKILWASDFKPIINPSALDLLKEIALSIDSSVRIAHVKTSNKKNDSYKKSEKKWEDDYFGKEIRHSFKKIKRSSVSKGIKFYLNHKDDNNLLVLIRREHGFLDKLFRKNHSEEFAQSPTLPVMIIHE
tara:strand:- start:301 stop:1008 length:708 start_codon:yes stop_codon:yes gene_type:complete